MSAKLEPLAHADAVRAGARIRALRRLRGWKQWELAENAGTAQSAVCHAETGSHRLVSVRAVASMAAALGTDLEGLLAGCGHCHGKPGPGFRCLLCGAEGELP